MNMNVNSEAAMEHGNGHSPGPPEISAHSTMNDLPNVSRLLPALDCAFLKYSGQPPLLTTQILVSQAAGDGTAAAFMTLRQWTSFCSDLGVLEPQGVYLEQMGQ